MYKSATPPRRLKLLFLFLAASCALAIAQPPGTPPIGPPNSIPKADIENRKWRIAMYRADKTDSIDERGLIGATEPAFIIFSNGKVDGSPGCGAWMGNYKLIGHQLEFHIDGIALAGLCRGKMIRQGGLVEKAFKSSTQVEEANKRVLLRDDKGQAQILLVLF